MKRLIPGRVELGVLVLLSVVCTVVVVLSPKTDIALAGSAMPLFLTACIMGMRRNDQLRRDETAD